MPLYAVDCEIDGAPAMVLTIAEDEATASRDAVQVLGGYYRSDGSLVVVTGVKVVGEVVDYLDIPKQS